MRGSDFFAQLPKRPPFTKLHPQVAAFFKGYFSKEKVIAFGDRFVVNTHFPPYPSPAFDGLVEQFGQIGEAATRRLYSVTLAVTNRCPFHCWHCYNAGRRQEDVPLARLQALAGELQQLGAVMLTLTGGEPLLREDLADIVRSFDQRTCLILGTTGESLTAHRARELRDGGLFAVGISLDSERAEEHDRLRGKAGAFDAALEALAIARENGLYPYVVAVATREFLERPRFLSFLRFAGAAGALEVHLLEPSATGRLAGQTHVLLSAAERQQILDYQGQVAQRDDLPILSSFAYLEAPEAFGCGAGLTHIYIDGSGEVCPCNLVPLSFGNLAKEPLQDILGRMGRYFCQPRPECVGRLLAGWFPTQPLPAPPETSEAICQQRLPVTHALPAFFRIRDEAREEVGAPEVRAAYDHVHRDYDAFWLVEAGESIAELVRELRWRGDETVFEAGCGTGYATALLARHAGQVLAVDLSSAMLSQAQARLRLAGANNVRFIAGDALSGLEAQGPFDCIFSSWVLGYIPLKAFFQAASRALTSGGQLAFIVHKDNSPRKPLELVAELAAEDPGALQKRVAFDFPHDQQHVRTLLEAVGMKVRTLREGVVVFRYQAPEQVLEHLLKSGAGTALYEAIDPARRVALAARFLQRLAQERTSAGTFEVHHEYVACVATKP
jgi:MoaA/NifB/PqqE/SkfB family radical SAM enzyme/protein-L-isoaspartate O-methyltransferase